MVLYAQLHTELEIECIHTLTKETIMPIQTSNSWWALQFYRGAACAITIMISTLSFAQDSQWAWVRVAPLAHDWEILEGKADVKIEYNKLSVTLFDGDHAKFKRFEIAGSISKNRIDSVERRLHSDVNPIRMKGLLSKVDCDRNGVGCTRLITLSDGWVFFGINPTQ